MFAKLRLPAFSCYSWCRMTTNRAILPPLLCGMAICGLAPANVVAQHVHGVVELGIVLEGSAVAVSLNAPLSDVVGFEHAPENDEQLELVRQAAAMLSNADAMFGLAGSADCRISGVSVDGPAYVTQHLAEDDAGSAESGHDHHNDAHDSHGNEADHDDHHEHAESTGHDHHEHADSADHDHDDHADSADHDEHDSEQHEEINASYEWECGNASALESLALHFTEGFVGVETIEIRILTSAGARVVTAEGRATSVSLSP